MEISENEYRALDKLRKTQIATAALRIRDILQQYYQPGVKVVIDGNCWRIEAPEGMYKND